MEESLTGGVFESRTNRDLANARLIPFSTETYPTSYLWPTDGEDRPAHPELLQFARRNSFDNWKSYSDEHVGFFYPDAPGIEVEVIGATDAIPLFGREMLPSEPGVFRRYRVTAGDTGTLFMISLSEAEGFDDTQRDWRPEVLKRLMPSGGGLLRASFLADGLARRVEIQGRGIRASVLDWPHLAVSQEVYLRMSLGIQLAPVNHPDIRQLKQAAIAKYGFEAKLGLLDRGSPPSIVLSTLGDPLESEPTTIEAELAAFEYSTNSGAETVRYKVPLERGYFVGFHNDWRTVSRPQPAEGSMRWMREKTSFQAGDAGGAGYDLGRLTEAEVLSLYDHVIRAAPVAPPEDWAGLCQVIANLAQHGLHDERVVDVIGARLEKNNADPAPALLALQACGSDMAKGKIANHIIDRFASPALDETALEQIYTLFGYLGKAHPATGSLIDRALCHTSNPVRELGFKFCSWLPQEYAMPHLEAGLKDASIEIRRHCADAFSHDCGDPELHTELLSACLSEEDDELVKAHLRGAIQRLTAETEGKDKH